MFITTEVEGLMIRFWHINGTSATVDGKTFYGQEYDAQDGFLYFDNFNESLDGGTVYLPPQDKIEFEPFDIVEITSGTNDSIRKTMLIDTYIETQVAFNPNKYKYQITLMSRTKALERVILPNIAWTKMTPAISCATAIQNLIEDYSPRAFINDSVESDDFLPIFKYSYINMPNELSNINVPEMQLQNPTLREAIDAVLSTINAICTINAQGEVCVVKLDARGNEINLNDGHINYIMRTQSAKDYASELDITLKNATQTELANVDTTTRSAEYISWRNSDEALLTTANVRIETQKPIYELLSLKICGEVFGVTHFIGSSTYSHYVYAEFDIVNGTYSWTDPLSGQTYTQTIENCVEEKSIYDGLDVNIKKRCVYWKRGDNKIEGWGKSFDTSAIWDKSVAENLIQYLTGSGAGLDKRMLGIKYATAAYDAEISGRTTEHGVNVSQYFLKELNLVDWQFKIEYLTETDVRIKAGKFLPEKHQHNELIDGQATPYVDILQLGRVEYAKVNRLGNSTMIIHANYNQESEMPNLGDTIGDFVLIRREMQIFDHEIVFKGILTEHNVNLNYFTGIAARKRSWQIVSANDAFKKELLKKYYCEFSFEPKAQPPSVRTNFDTCEVQGFARSLLFRLANNWVNPPAILPVMGALVTVDTGTTMWLRMEITKFISKNSISFITSFKDNQVAGTYMSDSDTGGYLQRQWNYCDSKGTNPFGYYTYVLSRLTHEMQVQLTDRESVEGNDDYQLVQQSYSRLLPRVVSRHSTSELFSTRFYNHKDTREIIGFNLQFEFCCDNSDIVFTEQFVREQHMMANTRDFYNQIKVYASTTSIYKQNDVNAKGSVIPGITVQIIAQNDSSAYITTYGWNNTDYATYRSYGICDNNGNLLIGINKPISSLSRKTTYLNILATRDRKYYDDTSKRTWGVLTTADPRNEIVLIKVTKQGSTLMPNEPGNNIVAYSICGVEGYLELPRNVYETSLTIAQKFKTQLETHQEITDEWDLSIDETPTHDSVVLTNKITGIQQTTSDDIDRFFDEPVPFTFTIERIKGQ